jgi:hypothetical protein
MYAGSLAMNDVMLMARRTCQRTRACPSQPGFVPATLGWN